MSYLRKGRKGRNRVWADVKMARMKSSGKLRLPLRQLCTWMVPSESVAGVGHTEKGAQPWAKHFFSDEVIHKEPTAESWLPPRSGGTKVFIPEGGPGGVLHSA